MSSDCMGWKEELTLGVGFIDDDHRRLAELMNRVFTVSNEGGDPDSVNQAFIELVNFTWAHFSREERAMAEHGYPQRNAHKIEHLHLIEQVSHLAQQLKTENGGKMSDDLAQILCDWVTGHILSADKLFARYLRSVGAAE